MKEIAKLLSNVFHPLFFPLYGMVFLRFALPESFMFLPDQDQLDLFKRVIANGFLFPTVGVLLLRGLKFIDSMAARTRNERMTILIIMMFFYLWTAISLVMGPEVPEIVSIMFIGASISVVACFLATVASFKISIHTVGMGVLLGLVGGVAMRAEKELVGIVLLAILLTGAVGWSRLKLEEHTTKQVFAGYGMGLFCMIFAFIITPYLP